MSSQSRARIEREISTAELEEDAVLDVGHCSHYLLDHEGVLAFGLCLADYLFFYHRLPLFPVTALSQISRQVAGFVTLAHLNVIVVGQSRLRVEVPKCDQEEQLLERGHGVAELQEEALVLHLVLQRPFRGGDVGSALEEEMVDAVATLPTGMQSLSALLDHLFALGQLSSHSLLDPPVVQLVLGERPVSSLLTLVPTPPLDLLHDVLLLLLPHQSTHRLRHRLLRHDLVEDFFQRVRPASSQPEVCGLEEVPLDLLDELSIARRYIHMYYKEQ